MNHYTSSAAGRWAAPLAIAAGTAWLVLGVESIALGGVENYRNALFLVPWILTIGAVHSLHRLQASPSNEVERWGYAILMGGLVLGAVGQPGIIWDIDPLKALAFSAFGAFLVGTVTFGFGSRRAGVLDGKVALALAFTQVGTMAMGLGLSPWVPLESDGSYSGAVVHGAVFLAVGVSLLRRSGGFAGALSPTAA